MLEDRILLQTAGEVIVPHLGVPELGIPFGSDCLPFAERDPDGLSFASVRVGGNWREEQFLDRSNRTVGQRAEGRQNGQKAANEGLAEWFHIHMLAVPMQTGHTPEQFRTKHRGVGAIQRVSNL
jgi:hypothetical protein